MKNIHEKHTREPWELKEDRFGAAPEIHADGHIIAKVYFWSGSENVTEVYANAKLMAAAPNMLKNCQGAIAALTQNKTYRADVALAVKLLAEATRI